MSLYIYLSITANSCNLEKESNSSDEIYKIKGSQFGLFNIFSRLQIVIKTSKHAEVNLRSKYVFFDC